MNHDLTHTAEDCLEREDEDIPVWVTVRWEYCRGYRCSSLEAHHVYTNKRVELTDAEWERLMERYHHSRIPEPADEF